jgi:hypothetical protein
MRVVSPNDLDRMRIGSEAARPNTIASHNRVGVFSLSLLLKYPRANTTYDSDTAAIRTQRTHRSE